MTKKMINCGQFAKMAGISVSKMHNLARYNANVLPRPVIDKQDINGKLYRRWEEYEVIDFLAHTSLKDLQYYDINKKRDNKHERLLTGLFVNRQRPKIHADSLILKYPCQRCTQHLKEHDAPRLRQFDKNFGQYL